MAPVILNVIYVRGDVDNADLSHGNHQRPRIGCVRIRVRADFIEYQQHADIDIRILFPVLRIRDISKTRG